MIPKKRVVVGLSGGVDSAVSALLLTQNNNYEVIAVFMRNWDSFVNNELNHTEPVCSQELDYQDAQKVATFLNIPLYRADFVTAYWNDVFSYFLRELKANRTPNPDVFCNKYIKFAAFWKYAQSTLKADYIAMGHYAQIKRYLAAASLALLRGADPNKDQSYFLAQLSKKQLEPVIFPIGHLLKSEVREIASLHKLPNATKKDSTGICFVGNRNFQTFLKNYLPMQPGPILDITTGQQLGLHDGVYYYTIGQRHHLNLSGMKASYFVVDKDAGKNILYVACDNENVWLMHDTCEITDTNWIIPFPETGILNCVAKFRYRQPDVPVTVRKMTTDSYLVTAEYKIRAITPGQIAVFYQDDVCLGSGIIKKIKKDYLR